jgi:peptide/nickel transport system substrate-binding protein
MNKPFSRHVRSLYLIATVVTVILASCAPGAEPTSAPVPAEPTSAPVPAEPTSEPVPAEPTPTPVPAEPTPEPPFTAVIGIPGDVTSMNPIHQATENTVIVTEQMMEPLVILGPEGEYLPWLATSWDIVDPTTWRFSLREGVKFTNGEPFTAEAVKFTLDEVRNPDNQAKFLPLVKDIVDVRVIDEYTVEIVTEAPNPIFLVEVARTFIMPPEHTRQVGHDGFEKEPVGTGAYKFVEWAKGDHVTLDANPEWWNGQPKVDRLVFRIVPEDSARVAALQSGELDVAWNIPFESIPQIEATEGASVLTRTGAIAYIGLDTLHGEPLANKLVRQALNYAVDAESIVKYILQGRGYATPGALWKISPGWDPSLPIMYDPAKAKELLKQAGYPDGFSMQMEYASTNQALLKPKEVAEAIQSQLAEVGVTVELIDMEEGAMFDAYTGKQLHAYFFCWRSNPEAARHVNVLINSKTRGYYYLSPEADKYIDAYMTTMDPVERAEAGKKMNEYLHEDCPWIFLYAQDEAFATSGRVNWNINVAASDMYYGIELAPAQ